MSKQWDVAEWLQEKCPNCGRMRLNISVNGKKLCEKCDYCPDEKRTITDEELDNG